MLASNQTDYCNDIAQNQSEGRAIWPCGGGGGGGDYPDTCCIAEYAG